MSRSSWLFIKDEQSIWIERLDQRTMIVAGPGSERDERVFSDEDALQAFQITLGERLTEGGWFLWGFNRERRQAADRRRVARPVEDRRRRLGA
jgi:hypothetical protein